MRRPGIKMRAEIQENETKLVNEAGSDTTTKNVAGKPQSVPQRLDALLMGVETSLTETQSAIVIRNVACDSRKAQPQGLFFALQGAKEDGAKFARDAVSRGAIAVVSEAVAPPLLPDSIAWVRVAYARKALAI